MNDPIERCLRIAANECVCGTFDHPLVPHIHILLLKTDPLDLQDGANAV
jgi:hypothetical protein